MIAKTLAELQSALENTADIIGQVGVGDSFRHQQAWVTSQINQAFSETKSKVVSLGFRWYLKTTGVIALPANADTNENFSSTTLPSDCYSVQHVSALTNGFWHALQRIDYEQLRDYDPRMLGASGNTNAPFAYCVFNFGDPTSKIAFLPFSPGSYELLYLPQHTDVTVAGNPFYFADALHIERTILVAAFRISGLRDGDSKGRATAIAAQLAQVDAEIAKAVPKVIQTGARTMTRDRSRDGWGYFNRGW